MVFNVQLYKWQCNIIPIYYHYYYDKTRLNVDVYLKQYIILKYNKYQITTIVIDDYCYLQYAIVVMLSLFFYVHI